MKPFPESVPEPYDFTNWEAEYFRCAGEFLTRIVERKDMTNMRRALLRLYFEDQDGSLHQ